MPDPNLDQLRFTIDLMKNAVSVSPAVFRSCPHMFDELKQLAISVQLEVGRLEKEIRG